METKIKATMDLAFKKVFASPGNEPIIAGLVKDFFGFTPKEIIITNPYDIKRYEKMCRDGDIVKLQQTLNDISAKMNNGEFVAEMQVRRQDVFGARALYYSFSKFCSNYDRSENDYGDLTPVYALNVLEETYFNSDSHAVKIFRLFDEYVNIGMDKEYLTVGFFELAKTAGFRNANQKYWRKYFLGKSVPAEAPEYIRQAEEIIRVDNLSKEEWEVLSYKERYDADRRAEYRTAKNEGRVEGRMEKASDIARRLKDKGAETALIIETTGLTAEEVAAL